MLYKTVWFSRNINSSVIRYVAKSEDVELLYEKEYLVFADSQFFAYQINSIKLTAVAFIT